MSCVRFYRNERVAHNAIMSHSLSAVVTAIRRPTHKQRTEELRRVLHTRPRSVWFPVFSLRARVDLQEGEHVQCNALEACMVFGAPECIRMLLDHGANPFGDAVWPGVFCHVCASLDARLRQSACLRLLLEACGGAPRIECMSTAESFSHCIQEWATVGSVECVRVLLESMQALHMDPVTCVHNHALRRALHAGSVDVIRLLLDAGVRPGADCLQGVHSRRDDVVSCVRHLVAWMQWSSLDTFLTDCCVFDMAAAARITVAQLCVQSTVASMEKELCCVLEVALSTCVRHHSMNTFDMLLTVVEDVLLSDAPDVVRIIFCHTARMCETVSSYDCAAMLIARQIVQRHNVFKGEYRAFWSFLYNPKVDEVIETTRTQRMLPQDKMARVMQCIDERNPLKLQSALRTCTFLPDAFKLKMCETCIANDAAECLVILYDMYEYVRGYVRGEIRCTKKDTLLHSMFGKGAYACAVRMLRRIGILPKLTDSLVMCSVCMSQSEMLRLLLLHGANPSAAVRSSVTGFDVRPLDIAAGLRNEECIRVLMESARRSPTVQLDILGALHSVCSYGEIKGMKTSASKVGYILFRPGVQCAQILLLTLMEAWGMEKTTRHLDSILSMLATTNDTSVLRVLLSVLDPSHARVLFQAEDDTNPIARVCQRDSVESLRLIASFFAPHWRRYALTFSVVHDSEECLLFAMTHDGADFDHVLSEADAEADAEAGAEADAGAGAAMGHSIAAGSAATASSPSASSCSAVAGYERA
jgi:hypothetical protein